MANSNLGLYDMVLALSESKINHEIKNLYSKGIIDSDWCFLTDLTGSVFLNQSDKTFEQVKAAWLNSVNLRKEIKELDSRIETLDEEIDNLEEQDEDTSAQRKKRKVLKEELKNKKIAADQVSKYSVLVDASTKSPTIEIEDREYFSLLFKVNIDEGSIFYSDGAEIKKDSINRCVYAFNVPVGKITIDKDQMLLTGEVKRVLREEGINDNDFTIEALLLNFERADVASYAESKSSLPVNIKSKTNLQIATVNYFKSLADSANPYVLGYAVEKKELKKTEKALLYPTSSSFSTNKSLVPRASSFNFLLQTNNNKLPQNETAGIIPHPLVEKAIDKTSTVNGTFGINYAIFKEQYLKLIQSNIISCFESAFRNNFGDSYKKYDEEISYDNASSTRFYFEKHNFEMKYFLIPKGIENAVNDDGSTFVRMSYDLAVEGNYHQEIQKEVLFFIKAGTVGVDQRFSTFGGYEINGNRGRRGNLKIDLIASDEGKVELKARLLSPKIGKNTEKPEYRDGLDAFWDEISKYLVNPFDMVGNLMKLFANDKSSVIEFFDDRTFENINFDNLQNLSNKVILPGSNVFTFKNVRLLDGSSSENDALLFDIAYAPIAS